MAGPLSLLLTLLNGGMTTVVVWQPESLSQDVPSVVNGAEFCGTLSTPMVLTEGMVIVVVLQTSSFAHET